MNTKNSFEAEDIPEREKYKSIAKSHWIFLFIFLLLATLVVDQGAWYFRTSVLPTESHKPYDGTTLPVLKVAKWTDLSKEQWDQTYDELNSANKLIPLPTYDPNILKIPTEQLGWSSDYDLNARNAKITFSVPYLGNYTLDGIEGAGSHLAVDIKLPSNTPVYSIGNGTVVKVSEQTTGFGKHIVIKHENFPSFNDSSSTETFYSSYSHLGSVLIAENEVVTKGQLIGKSGQTGTATTPHLHFQIDNSKAPWHPYWPFTYQEAADAGYSFTDAVNEGLGKDRAIETTVNPMLYVQKYMSGFSNTADYTATTSSTETPEETPDAVVPDYDNFDLPPVSDSEDAVVEEDIEVSNPAVELKIGHDGNFVVGQPETITVTAIDEYGKTATAYSPEKGLYVDMLLGGADTPNRIENTDIVDGVAVFEISPKSDWSIQIKVTDGNISGQSEVLKSNIFSDVSSDSVSYDAITFLKEHGVISGYPDGTFKPDAVVSRVEALKFILNGINSDLITANVLPFPDTNAQEWYSTYVATGYNRQIVEGYPDSTFKPANTVNKVEFLKMLLTAMQIDVEENLTEDVYEDVPKDEWYAPYVNYAKDKNLIVIENNKFYPETGMTREEVAELIYRTILLKVSGAKKYSSGIEVSDSQVSTYFS